MDVATAKEIVVSAHEASHAVASVRLGLPFEYVTLDDAEIVQTKDLVVILYVSERYTRDTPESIVYDVTIEDPVVFTKPWRQQQIPHLRAGERIREYECTENNEDLQRIEKLLQNESVSRVPQ
ncbi:MAG: hypothetical protein FJW14_06895 [Acidimicrobiia bacterium]|nr:hypothetical protein [Acidimicrobiia bacterium]